MIRDELLKLVDYWASPHEVYGDRRFFNELNMVRISITTVWIMGCGSVGSKVAIELARVGFRQFQLFDGDTVKVENLAFQAFDEGDVGRSKSVALAEKIQMVASTCEVKPAGVYQGAAVPQSPNTIAVCSFHSFAGRRLAWGQLAPTVTAYFDARTGFNQAEVYSVALDQRKQAEAVAEFSKSLAHADPPIIEGCPMQTSPIASSFAAALTTQAIIEWARGGKMMLWRYFDFDHNIFHVSGEQPGRWRKRECEKADQS